MPILASYAPTSRLIKNHAFFLKFILGRAYLCAVLAPCRYRYRSQSLTIFVPRSTTREIASRAYLNFHSSDALHKFHQLYQGHAFVDSKGSEHKAQLEWAPYQRVELAAAPRDPLQGTIGAEADYLAFVQAPNEDSKRATVVPAVPPTSTPLLDELRAKALKQRQRQAERNARRNNRRGGKREGAANNSNGGANNSNNLYKRTLKKNAAQGGQTPQSGGQSHAAETPAAPKKSQRRDRSKKGNNKPKPVQPKSTPSAVAPVPTPVVPPVPVTPKLLSRPKISLSSAEFVPKQHATPPPAQYKNFLE